MDLESKEGEGAHKSKHVQAEDALKPGFKSSQTPPSTHAPGRGTGPAGGHPGGSDLQPRSVGAGCVSASPWTALAALQKHPSPWEGADAAAL